ncbi:MAG TPA: cobyrinate a,c-diamide synthase [Thermodesulfobacteriota bacterium]|nr:cobyrinate a,c-diamide synthase [Thermodesulfobacteriota bacterium]
MSQPLPRIIIAGTQSGTGKTSLSLALVVALKRRGLRVQTFKIGPDFLDPSYLTLASGRPCYNLDGWMTRKEYVLDLLRRTTKDADISVIEGVMGLFDGSDPENSEGSTAEMACWLDAPVLLVVNVHGMARSLSALVKGCVEFERGLKIAGVIANHSGSDHHKDWLIQSLRSASLPPLLGAIPRGAFSTLPSRHLGLVTADPQHLSPKLLDELADVLEAHLPVNTILQIARNALPLSVTGPGAETKVQPKRISIGVAFDKAFHFYYPDNLDELKIRGCDLVFFSPLQDRILPEEIDGLYFGGGYPEEYAETLAENREMQEAVRQFARRGLPLYAECGGLIYLTQGIETTQGKRCSMVGLLPVWSKMLNRLKSLGYVEVTLTDNSLWGERGSVLRGHEFHYSELAGSPQENPLWTPVYRVKRRRSERIFTEGYQQKNVLASYVHLHWASQPRNIETFIDQCGVCSLSNAGTSPHPFIRNEI